MNKTRRKFLIYDFTFHISLLCCKARQYLNFFIKHIDVFSIELQFMSTRRDVLLSSLTNKFSCGTEGDAALLLYFNPSVN